MPFAVIFRVQSVVEKAITDKDKYFFVPKLGLALFLVLALDLWLGMAHPLQFAVTPNLDRTETFGSMQVYKQSGVKPDVVLLGSSLVVAPVMQSESIMLQQPIPRFRHRHSQFLQAALSRHLDSRPEVFCFAVAGAAVSDAYTIVRHLLAGKNNPKVIVYGIAPRDFQDNTWPGIDSTEIFQVLADFREAGELFNTADLSWERKLNIVFGRASSLWKYRSDLRMLLTLRLKKIMERTMPWVVFDKYGETLELKPRRKGQFPEEAFGELRVFPGVAMENVGSTKTIQQYINRYRPLNARNVELQFAYLEKLLSFSETSDINFVIVNMPLSRTNLELLPEGFYDPYKERVAGLCAKHHVEYIDMQLPSYENESSYVDTVHLKPEHSQAFLEELCSRISKLKVARVLVPNGQDVASTAGKSI